jgi:hypothetical protein
MYSLMVKASFPSGLKFREWLPSPIEVIVLSKAIIETTFINY